MTGVVRPCDIRSARGSAPADVRALVTQMQRTAYDLQLPLDGRVEEAEFAPDAHLRLND